MHPQTPTDLWYSPRSFPTVKGPKMARGLSSWRHVGILAIVLLTGIFSSPFITNATMIVPVSTTDLAQQAAAIIIGEVKAIESYWDDTAQQVFTHITLTPQEVLKGTIANGDLILKQVGGVVGNRRTWLDGAPELTRGEKVLLFLDTNPDGSAGIAQLYQGKFSVFTDLDSGKEMAYRGNAPDGVHLLPGQRTARAQTTSSAEEFHELSTFRAQIHEALRSSSTGPAQRNISSPFATPIIPLESQSEVHDGFVAIGPPFIRWFEPDSGLPVVVSINPTNAFPGGEDRIDEAFQAWNSASNSTFRFKKGNPTNSQGFTVDQVNTISFNDPKGQLPDPVNCGGILAAVLHTAISDESRTLHEQTFIRILEADLIFNNGWDNCVAFKSQSNIAEVTTHELGHVLGLGHSPNPEATMAPIAHFDGRGATLHPDDADGVAFLYPDVSFPPCTYSLSPSKRSLDSRQSIATATVKTRNACGWTAQSSASWIVILEGGSSSGSGTITYSVLENTTGASRRGSIFVGSKKVKIKQKRTRKQSVGRRTPPFAAG